MHVGFKERREIEDESIYLAKCGFNPQRPFLCKYKVQTCYGSIASNPITEGYETQKSSNKGNKTANREP